MALKSAVTDAIELVPSVTFTVAVNGSLGLSDEGLTDKVPAGDVLCVWHEWTADAELRGDTDAVEKSEVLLSVSVHPP
jgi:hypothetical protein